MSDNKVTTIIAADYMYLVLLGNQKNVKIVLDKINSNRINDNIQYILNEIDTPCAELLESATINNILIDDVKKTQSGKNIDIDLFKKYITIGDGVETAQCLVYSDAMAYDYVRNISNIIMLMTISGTCNDSSYKLGFPILQLDEEENPEKLLAKWLKENDLEKIVKEITIKPVNIVGTEHDILVFTAFITSLH